MLKKLARRQLMYHSYSMQVHGYVFDGESGNEGLFTLVHGVSGYNCFDAFLGHS